MQYYVILARAWNPVRRGEGSPVDELKRERVKVNTFQEASDACLKYISRNDLDNSQWTGGQIFYELDNPHYSGPLAYVSYDGRVWDLNDKEIPLEPNGD